MTKYRPALIAILDGWGIGKNDESNAIYLAKTPNLTNFLKNYPSTTLKTNGLDVGLPRGVMGNSEVGHQNIGAGRIVYQSLAKINVEIENGDFFKNKAIDDAFLNAKKHNTALHFMGLLSDGGVHSDISHLFALLQKAKQMNMHKVYIHALMDGRDTSPTSGINYMQKLENTIKELGVGQVATVMGRYYAMDRDNNYDRNLFAYKAIVYGEGKIHSNPVELLQERYNENQTDEFIMPTVIKDSNGNIPQLKENDSLIFFNFRPDRSRQITKTFLNKVNDDPKNIFQNIKTPNIFFTSFTEYQAGLNENVAYPPDTFTNTLGEYLSKIGLTQLRIAETEKYAHVTFFFNGGSEKVFPGEDRILVPSPKEVDGYYDRKPEMSAYTVTEKLLEAIESDKYDVIVLNFANMDMVGHTGVIPAAITAVETVDTCIGKVITAIQKKNGLAIVTADHGNADHMTEENGSPMTAHSMNKVPMVVISNDKVSLKNEGKLADIAPTLLALLKIEKPSEMTGESLLV